MPSSSIKDERMYQDLRQEGNSEENSARIANAAAANGKSEVGRRGGRSGAYEAWTVAELRKRARDMGLTGYSRLSKDKLIDELRSY